MQQKIESAFVPALNNKSLYTYVYPTEEAHIIKVTVQGSNKWL